MKPMIAFAALILLGSAGASADEAWPQFRGPGGSGVADGQKPPIHFGPDKNVKWKVKAPSGISSPIVAGDKLVITAFDGGKLWTIAYNRADGKEAWRAEAPAAKIEAFHKTESSPASSTPVTDGKRIVSYFGSCGLFCYDLSGKELWKFELPTAVILGNFGSGVSPIIADGMVILLRDVSKDAKILAVDLATGKLKWEKKRLSPVSYGTPIIWDTPAGKQIVASGHGRLIGYDLKTGARTLVRARHALRVLQQPRGRGRHVILCRLVARPGERLQDAELRRYSQAGRRGKARLFDARGLRKDHGQGFLRKPGRQHGRQGHAR